MIERWLPVVGLEGLYEVSDLGRVRSVERLARSARSRTGFRLVPSKMRKETFANGYVRLHLSGGGEDAYRSVHLMVLEAFRGSRPSALHDGCHGDGNRLNNTLGNLRWDTKSGNKRDSFIHGTAVYGERVGNSKLTVADVLTVLKSSHSSNEEAKRLGVAKSTVQRIRNGRTWARTVVGVVA